MKKLLGITVALALVLTVSAKAGATSRCFFNCGPKPTPVPVSNINVDNHDTDVVTVAKANVETGSVNQMGGKFNYVSTGNVYSVGAVALSQVNMTTLPGCACSKVMNIDVSNHDTDVTTVAKADVETGKVGQWSMFGFQTVKTGKVEVVGVNATTVANYTDFSVETPTVR